MGTLKKMNERKKTKVVVNASRTRATKAAAQEAYMTVHRKVRKSL